MTGTCDWPEHVAKVAGKRVPGVRGCYVPSHSGTLAASLGVQPAAVLKAAHRGAQEAARWRDLLTVKR